MSTRRVAPAPASAASSLLRGIVPAGVGVGEHWAGQPVPPAARAELALVRGAGPRRTATFARGRHVAREAMRDLGAPVRAVLAGEQGEPTWPDGLIGSLTHCRHYAAAVIARSGDVPVLGVDAEPDEPLLHGGLALVATAAERRGADALHHGVGGGVHADRLLFSAKESVYKAWFPLTRRRIGFLDVVLWLSETSRTFEARPLVDPRAPGGGTVHGFRGSWSHGGGVLVTAVWGVTHEPCHGDPELTTARRRRTASSSRR